MGPKPKYIENDQIMVAYKNRVFESKFQNSLIFPASQK